MDCALVLHRWRKWIRFAIFIVYILTLAIALPLCIMELQRKGAADHVQAWFVGGIFVLMALPISFGGMLQHIINYTNPNLQRHIIRILWMVPIYALNAWFALRFPSAAIYLDTLRECYEAYVIYNFMAYLLAFLNQEYPHLDVQIENKPPVSHMFPVKYCLPPCHYSLKFIQRCKHGVLQYTVVRPAMTVLALICEIFDKYNEGDFDFKTSWSYIVIINNLSQILAMYCLVLFYRAFKEELHPMKPVPKFLCVKAVVFLSFWQSLAIAILAKVGAIPTHGPWLFYKDVHEVSTGIQDFLICIEMFLAAIAHYFSFSHKPFVNLAAEQQNCFTSFLSMWDVRDVTEDVVEHARYIGRGVHKSLSRGKRLNNSGSSERTPLLADGSVQSSSGATEPPTPAVILDDDSISYGGDSTASGHRYDSFVNKSTTASLNNYLDDRPDVRSHHETSQNQSSSVSLKGYDSSEEDMEESSHGQDSSVRSETQVHAEADSSANSSKRNMNDEEFEHLAVHEDDQDQDSKPTHSKDVKSSGGSDSAHEAHGLEASARQSLEKRSEDSVDETEQNVQTEQEVIPTHSDNTSEEAESSHDINKENPIV